MYVFLSLHYELTYSFLFEFENDGMEPSKRYSFISLLFILKCLSKTTYVTKEKYIFFAKNNARALCPTTVCLGSDMSKFCSAYVRCRLLFAALSQLMHDLWVPYIPLSLVTLKSCLLLYKLTGVGNYEAQFCSA